jgi:hypothetical protein
MIYRHSLLTFLSSLVFVLTSVLTAHAETESSEHKDHAKVLDKKFDELFKKAQENPDEPPPRRDIDWD